MRTGKPLRWVILFFTALTLIGLLTAADYGLPCDEAAEQVILQENLKEYAYRFLGAQSAAVKDYDAVGIQRISESVERDHGEAAFYPAAPLLTLADSAPDWMTTLWHAYTWLWFMVGVVSLYALARALGAGTVSACAASLFLYLSPRFFAEGHYNNKDVVLLSLVLWTLAAGAQMLREPTVRQAVFFSLAGALATNTKIVGALAWSLVGITLLLTLLLRGQLNGKRLRAGLAAIVSFVLFYALFTPALWGDPYGFFVYVLSNAGNFSRWTGVVLFNGVYYNPSRSLLLPRAYLPVMVAVTVPVVYLLFAALGQVRAVYLCVQGDRRRPLLIVLTLAWLLPVAYVIIGRPLMYNGWRHFYFIYAGVAAMGALSLQAAWDVFRHRRVWKRVFAIALCAAFAFQAIGIAANHPYQYVYYNALAGNVQERFELDYWDVGTVNAMRRLCALASAEGAQTVELGSRDEMSFFGVTHGYEVLRADERAMLTPTTDANAPYLFYNTTYAAIYDVAPPEGYHTLFSLQGYGNTFCTVYQRDSGD